MSKTGRYRKVALNTWSDGRFRALTSPPPNGQTMWLYLLTGPVTTIIPGVIVAGPSTIGERLGWPVEGSREAFREVLTQGMAKADLKAPLVWLPKAIEYNPPASPNVVKSWAGTWSEIPECGLKAEIYESLKDFLEALGKGFAEAFAKGCEKPSLNQDTGHRIQEQEAGTGGRVPAGRDSGESSVSGGSGYVGRADEKSPPRRTSEPDPPDNPNDPITIHLPLADKTEHPIRESQIAEWRELFPAVDVPQALRNMRAWLLANPTKRKTPRGIDRFVTNWLTRDQDRGGSGGAPGRAAMTGYSRNQSAAEQAARELTEEAAHDGS